MFDSCLLLQFRLHPYEKDSLSPRGSTDLFKGLQISFLLPHGESSTGCCVPLIRVDKHVDLHLIGQICLPLKQKLAKQKEIKTKIKPDALLKAFNEQKDELMSVCEGTHWC